jgi:hypothetical protein
MVFIFSDIFCQMKGERNMDTAEYEESARIPSMKPHAVSAPAAADEISGRAASTASLVNDIDDLRQMMADMFVKEASLTADPVIRISRQLDVKINEYMKQWSLSHKKAR